LDLIWIGQTQGRLLSSPSIGINELSPKRLLEEWLLARGMSESSDTISGQYMGG
jgi:hypothetical protein